MLFLAAAVMMVTHQLSLAFLTKAAQQLRAFTFGHMHRCDESPAAATIGADFYPIT